MNKEKILAFPTGGKNRDDASNKVTKLLNEISSLEAFILTAPVIIECGEQVLDVVEILKNAVHHGYQFVDISGSTAVIDIQGDRYRIHSQALQIADYAIAVCRALISEAQSNEARLDWMDARRRLQDKTNSIHDLGDNDNAGGI